MSLFNRVLHHEDSKSPTNSPPLSTQMQKSSSQSSAHKHSLLSLHHKQPPKTSQPSNVSLSIELESPPVVLYGSETESTGSIISGLLLLNLANTQMGEPTELDQVTLSLVQTIKLTKPFLISSTSVHNCEKCHIRKNTLARWDVVTAKSSFSSGSHAYPFSHLLPGSLPPSSKLGSKNSVSFIKYDIVAVAKVSGSPSEITVKLPLNISRLILKGPDRNSLRVFPPTEVSASAVLPNVVYPKSTFPVELRLENMNTEDGTKRWRMRKVTWRVEEISRIRAYCCPNHQSKLKSVEDAQRKAKPQPKQKSTNVHYSTIQTSLLMAPENPNALDTVPNDNNPRAAANPLTPPISSPSIRPSRNADPTGLDGAPAYTEDETEVERSRPTHALENFQEDFEHQQTPNPQHTPASNASSTPNASNNSTPSYSSSPRDLHLYTSETRTVSHGEIKSGWKSDFTDKGKIELVAEIKGMDLSTGLVKPTNKASSKDGLEDETQEGLRHGANIACDIEDPNEGIFISHLLIMEVVVAEETINKKARSKSKTVATGLEPMTSHSSAMSTDSHLTNDIGSPQVVGTPTGAARVLRMQFKLTVTERSGLGIAWDDEVPPTYEDVRTLSPPTYESSACATPNIDTPLSVPSSVALRTPGILYGIGDTPNIALGSGSIDGLLEIDDRIQDLTI